MPTQQYGAAVGLQYKTWRRSGSANERPQIDRQDLAKYFELPNGTRIANDTYRCYPQFQTSHDQACIVQLRGMPLSVLTVMYMAVKPLLDAMEYVGQIPRREAMKINRVTFDKWDQLASDPDRAHQVSPDERHRTYDYNPDLPVPTHGARWLNGRLTNDAARDEKRDWLHLARLDHSEPGVVSLEVLPAEQQHQFSVRGLITAEAMVAIDKGVGVIPAGTPVKFFLLD